MQPALQSRIDALLYAEACLLTSVLPKPNRTLAHKPLVLRPGSMRNLVCADLALDLMGLDSRDFNWLIEPRARPWANYRGIPHLCHADRPLGTPEKVWDRYGLVINSEQSRGLTEAYAILSRSESGRLVSDRTAPYDWSDRHETLEFGRLFSAALDLPDVRGPVRPRQRQRPASEPPLVLLAGREDKSRRLSQGEWHGLIERWQNGRAFRITGGPDDNDFAAGLADKFTGKATPLVCSFDEMCEAVSRSEEVLVIEGTGTQIASFFGVPATAIFTSGRERKWHPLGECSRLWRRHDLACQPCARFEQVPPCPNHFACKELGKVEPVPVW